MDEEKLTEYCLNPLHPRGRHKAKVFETVLGIRREDAALLRRLLLDAARTEEAIAANRDEYGQRYAVDFTMKTESGEAIVRSNWIIWSGEGVPRLTSCFVR